MSTDALLKSGVSIYREAIGANFRSNQSHVVPISGGMDSRAILATLLEHTEAHNIKTFSFGSPGTLDYDIGCEIAKISGTQHTAFDLTKYTYTQEELEDIAQRIDHQTVLFHHWPVWAADQIYPGATVWSGFLGDPLSGSHLPTAPAKDIQGAIGYFISKNRYVQSHNFTTNNLDFSALVELPIIGNTSLTFEEQIDLRNRQTKFIAPHVLMKGYQWCTPFTYQPWVDFILSVPNKFRKGQNLYKKILVSAFPGPFSHRTKSNHGLKLDAPVYYKISTLVSQKIQRALGKKSSYINYIDFESAIRERNDIRELIARNVIDLSERKILDGIDTINMLNAHMSGHRNYADVLIALASLEIHIKAGMPLTKMQ